MKLCEPCIEKMYSLYSSSAPFKPSMFLSRAIDLPDSCDDDMVPGIDMSQVLPSFFEEGARMFPYKLLLHGLTGS